MNLHRPVRIGSFETRGNLFLAPVAGYSDAAFRSVCADMGCDLAFTEMVSSEALVRDSRKTEVLLERAGNEQAYAVQLFGANPDVMAAAARIVVERWRPALLDVNCGCPVPKIVRSGAGSALMRDLPRMAAIVAVMRDAVDVPVTVKIRLGWDDGSMNYLEAAAAAVGAGAAAVTLHARTRIQGYSGTVDAGAFGRLAGAVPVPVFASGDMFEPADALAALDGSRGTPVAGVMLARGAMGNPFLFARTAAALEGRPEPVITPAMRAAIARRHFGLSLGLYGERLACAEFRKQACAYLKGTPGGAALRARAVACSSAAEYEAFFEAWESAGPAATGSTRA